MRPATTSAPWRARFIRVSSFVRTPIAKSALTISIKDICSHSNYRYGIQESRRKVLPWSRQPW